MVADGANVTVGKPFISDASVEAKVLKQARSKKIIVFNVQSKVKIQKKTGTQTKLHRTRDYQDLKEVKQDRKCGLVFLFVYLVY